MDHSNTRPAVLAGTWYPADPDPLARQVDQYLAAADPAQLTAGQPFLALSPHAGYSYSGPTAGKLFGLLREHRPGTVILLAPNHRLAIDSIALAEWDAFETPLGQIPVAVEAVRTLSQYSPFAINNAAHQQEHAVEILLPFLQRTWPDDPPVKVLPMLVPHLSADRVVQAGHQLARLRDTLEGPVLTLVSSDFTHYGAPFGYMPFTRNIPQSLEKLDSGAILKILAGKADPLLNYGAETGITMCGLPAAAVALSAGLPEGYEAGLIDYTRSGDQEGDYSHSVSYASILFTSGQEVPA